MLGNPTFWQGLFRGKMSDMRQRPKQVTITATSCMAVEILMRVCHETPNQDSYEVDISELWQ